MLLDVDFFLTVFWGELWDMADFSYLENETNLSTQSLISS